MNRVKKYIPVACSACNYNFLDQWAKLGYRACFLL